MVGTIVNTIAVLLGGTIGLFLKKGLSEKISDTVMKGLGLCTIYIGISGSLEGQNTLFVILSIVIGAFIGEGIDLDAKLNQVAAKLEKHLNGNGSVAEGFVSASLLFCVGAMTIVGALQSGLTGNHEMLFTKSMLDFISSIIFASTLGIGVLFSAAFLFVYQGAITLLAGWVAPLLSDTVVSEMTCVGSLIIIGLGLNMLGITKLKVMNYVPAIFIPIFIYLIKGLF